MTWPLEHCREWNYDKHSPCNAPAEFILWGKLLPREALGPRCYDHAAKHVPIHQISQWAVFDLRGLVRKER